RFRLHVWRPWADHNHGRLWRTEPRVDRHPFRETLRVDWPQGFHAARRWLRLRGLRFVPFPDGVYGRDGDDSDRRRSRTLEVLGVHDLRLLHRNDYVSGLWQLGVGRRLAFSTGG